ncbi:transposase [Streptomyces europaeiscabiei]|uniref:transposase n=1 Tax=Streptomyces europaeiscabiei TaxID=146819 RepID=UPI002E173DE9
MTVQRCPTIKVHLAADGRGLRLAIVVTPGDANDSTMLDTVLGAVRVPRLSADCVRDALLQGAFMQFKPYMRLSVMSFFESFHSISGE